MAKDYKSYSKTTPTKQKGQSKAIIVWIILAGLVALVVYGFYTFKHHEKKLPVVITTVAQKVAAVVPKIPDQPSIKFEFYSLLTKEKVPVTKNTAQPVSSVPAPAVRAAPIATATATTGATAKPVAVPAPVTPSVVSTVPAKPLAPQTSATYVVQVAALKTEADGNTIKARFVAQGFTAQVRKITVNNVDWYRVEIGPYTNLADAQAAQKQLQKNGVNGIIKTH